jgi:hypothetical protein
MKTRIGYKQQIDIDRLFSEDPIYPVKNIDPKTVPAPEQLEGAEMLRFKAACKLKKLRKAKKAPSSWYFFEQEMRRRPLYDSEVKTILEHQND